MEHGDAGIGNSSEQGAIEHHSSRQGVCLQSCPTYEAQSWSSAPWEGQQVRMNEVATLQAHPAIYIALLSLITCHTGRLHQSHDAKVMMRSLLLQMAEEGAAWEAPGKNSITCAVILPGVVIVASTQPHTLKALTLNQPGSSSVRCEG